MHSRRSSDTSVNELLKEGHAESPNGFLSSLKIKKLLKLATDSMVMHLILLMIKNCKTKATFAFILKESYLISKSRKWVFTFDFKRELDSSSFSVLATKFFHIAEPLIDLRNLLLRSLVAIINTWETCWIWVRRHLKGCMKSCRGCSSFYFLH